MAAIGFPPALLLAERQPHDIRCISASGARPIRHASLLQVVLNPVQPPCRFVRSTRPALRAGARIVPFPHIAAAGRSFPHTTESRSIRLAGAPLDRITHHVHILEMSGDSYRLKQSRSRHRRPSE